MIRIIIDDFYLVSVTQIKASNKCIISLIFNGNPCNVLYRVFNL